MTDRYPLAILLLGASLAGCGGHPPAAEPETVHRVSLATWFEDGFSSYDVSPDGSAALFRSWLRGTRLIDLARGREDPGRLRGRMDEVRWAVFDHAGAVARMGRQGDRRGWFLERDGGDRLLELPPFGLPRWAPDGSALAYDLGRALMIGAPDALHSVPLDGLLAAIGWAPDGTTLYALVADTAGSSSLLRVGTDGVTEAVQRGLDGPWAFDRLAVSPDGRVVYLTLVGTGAPDVEARHRPDADRDTDIYALEIATGALRPAVTGPGDDFSPLLVGDDLYWTHNEYRETIVVVPIEGGEARVVVDDGQLPYWSHDGRQLGYTVGGWRLADYALNLDAAVVDLDAEARPRGVPRPVVAGYHEDFTPVWSPDGRWMAYHSHRSPTAVPRYDAAGSTDDIYLQRTAPRSEPIRLTDFGWEVGEPDWSPDSRRLVFDSQDRDGTPGVSEAWIVEIDPATGRPLHVEKLETPEGPPGPRALAWSPTTDEIAVTYPLGGERFALAVLPLTGGPARQLADFEASTHGGLDWTADGEHLVFAALDDGHMQLFAISRSGGNPVRLTHDTEHLTLPQTSPDGRWIAATRLHRVKELRRVRPR